MNNPVTNTQKRSYGVGSAFQVAGYIVLICMILASLYLLIEINWLAILFLPYGWYFLIPIALISIGTYLKSHNK